MTDKELLNLLKKHKHTPELGGGAANFNWEKSWLAVCANLGFDAQAVAARRFSWSDYLQFAGQMFVRYFMQPAAVSLAAFVLIFGGWTASVSASHSLPGDVLYPVKLATERVRITMASSSQARAELHVEFAGRRLKEISEIKKTTDPGLIQKAMNDFNNQMNLVNKELAGAQNENPEAALALAALVGEKTAEYEAVLGVSSSSNQATASALEAVSQTDAAAINTIVQSHEETGASGSAMVLEQNFQNKFRALRARIAMSLGRLQVAEGFLTESDSLDDYYLEISAIRSIIAAFETDLRLAMDSLAVGGFRRAFEILKQIDIDLRLAESRIAEMEIALTAPRSAAADVPENPANNSLEEVVVTDGF